MITREDITGLALGLFLGGCIAFCLTIAMTGKGGQRRDEILRTAFIQRDTLKGELSALKEKHAILMSELTLIGAKDPVMREMLLKYGIRFQKVKEVEDVN